VRGGRQRRPRRPAQDEALAAPLDEEREVRAAAVADACRDDRPEAEPARIQERLDALGTISGVRSAIAAMLRVRRRLYLMRHAEASYAAPDPEVVKLTERGHEQAAAHRAGVSSSISVTSTLPRTAEPRPSSRLVSSRNRCPSSRVAGGRLDAVPRTSSSGCSSGR
jgi:hypothetical protein